MHTPRPRPAFGPALTRALAAAAALVLAVPAAAPAASAQDSARESAPAAAEDIGSREFLSNCAVCHGTDGTGTGPYAELLTTALPDLTRLSAGNDGVFPYDRVRRIIDGRADLAAHGPRDMPVWGYEYGKRAVDRYQGYYDRAQAEVFVRGRLQALIDHLQSIQRGS